MCLILPHGGRTSHGARWDSAGPLCCSNELPSKDSDGQGVHHRCFYRCRCRCCLPGVQPAARFRCCRYLYFQRPLCGALGCLARTLLPLPRVRCRRRWACSPLCSADATCILNCGLYDRLKQPAGVLLGGDGAKLPRTWVTLVLETGYLNLRSNDRGMRRFGSAKTRWRPATSAKGWRHRERRALPLLLRRFDH